jgi:hypothetical protein
LSSKIKFLSYPFCAERIVRKVRIVDSIKDFVSWLFIMALKRLVGMFKMVVRYICGVVVFCGGGVMPVVAAAYDRDEF